jgi:hypothetical protein
MAFILSGALPGQSFEIGKIQGAKVNEDLCQINGVLVRGSTFHIGGERCRFGAMRQTA